MGAGAAAGLTAALDATTADELQTLVNKMSPEQRERLVKTLACSAEPEQAFCKFPGVIVADIPVIPTEEIDTFRQKYLSNDKVENDDPRHDDLASRDVEIQFARWAWAKKNTDTYVNMLRVAGHKDEDIQACFNGERPLGFGQDFYAEFKASLRKLAADIEREMGWKRVRFAQMGSSVVGYSSNPFKGFERTPSKITNPAKSDMDMYVIAEGIFEWAEKCKTEGKPYPDKEYPTTTTFEEGCGDVRYRVKNFEDVCPALASWYAIWDKRFGGGIQFTFRRDANPKIAPWDGMIRL